MSDSFQFGSGPTQPRHDQPNRPQENYNPNAQFQPGPGVTAQVINQDPQVATSVMQSIMKKVFLYMFSGLIISGIIATAGMLVPNFYSLLYSNMWLLPVSAFAQLGVVFGFTFAARKAKAGTARVLFYVYSVLSGITLAVYLSYFTMQSVSLAFIIASLTFGGMAVWGYRTKRDLSPIGTAGRMLLIGAIIATLINLVLFFIAPGLASVLDMILNYVVVAIFVGLTAYDMQKIRLMAENSGVYYAGDGPEAVAVKDTIAINGALNLYLDFVNIFIRLLAITGRRR